jgi:hypothetical protein
LANLKDLVQSGSVRVFYPMALDSTRASRLAKLQSLNGADFEAEF